MVHNSGLENEVGGDRWKMVEVRVRRQSLASERCASSKEGFGGTETPDRGESTP